MNPDAAGPINARGATKHPVNVTPKVTIKSNLLIIEYGRQYHLLLGRLARIDVLVGEKVLAGEPVGIIPSTELTGTTLYLELRRNGQPINPLPWLAARRDRKRG